MKSEMQILRFSLVLQKCCLNKVKPIGDITEINLMDSISSDLLVVGQSNGQMGD